MTTLPNISDFNGSTVTEAGFKTSLSNLISYLTGTLGTSGTQSGSLSTLGSLASVISLKTSAYTILPTDRGKIFLCSGTFTLSVTAAATLGSGFSFIVLNIGTGTITLDPNASELIDSSLTKSIVAGNSYLFSTDSTKLYTLFDNSYTLPTAASDVLGGVKVGSGLTMTDGVLSVTNVLTGTNIFYNYTETSVPDNTSDSYRSVFVTYADLTNINNLKMSIQAKSAYSSSSPMWHKFIVNSVLESPEIYLVGYDYVYGSTATSVDVSSLTGLKKIDIQVKNYHDSYIKDARIYIG